MNIKEYISSGIIESYVLGLASAEERDEFELLCRQYPELVAARNEFELSLEKQMLSTASAVPSAVKQKLMQAVAAATEPVHDNEVAMDDERVKKFSPMRWVAAASILLLLGATYFAYNFYTENKKLKESFYDLQARMDSMEEEQRMMSDPNVTVVSLVGTTPAKASANIYWDTTSSNVFLVVKNMPLLPSDKQYQLWALIDGKPKDLGLFDVKGDQGRVILKMNNTQKAEAFAITIENRGNTGGPSLDQLQTMGKTNL